MTVAIDAMIDDHCSRYNQWSLWSIQLSMLVAIDAIDRMIVGAVAVDDVCGRCDRQDGRCGRCCRWCLRSMQSMIVAVDGIDGIDDRCCERRLGAYAHWYSLECSMHRPKRLHDGTQSALELIVPSVTNKARSSACPRNSTPCNVQNYCTELSVQFPLNSLHRPKS